MKAHVERREADERARGRLTQRPKNLPDVMTEYAFPKSMKRRRPHTFLGKLAL